MMQSIIRTTGFFFVLIFVLSSCASQHQAVLDVQETHEVVVGRFSAPVLLPGTLTEMNTAGFWIGMHRDPDRTVIPRDKIDAFNRSIRVETEMVQDLAYYPERVRGNSLAGMLKSTLWEISSKKYIQQDGSRANISFFNNIKAQMNLSSISPRVAVKFGFVTAHTPQRLLPTNTGLYSNMKSMDIDRLQNSSLDIGTPLVVLHATMDGRWLFAITPLSEGWVMAEHVGFCTRAELSDFLKTSPFVVTVSTKADVFLDEAMRSHHAYVRMGCRYPAEETETPGVVRILLPVREAGGKCSFKDAFIASSDVNSGYLPYTPRAIILQAFKLLNSPYGWGDMHGEQDCSRFIEEIFSTVGIQLPRNSFQQARVGRLIASFNGSFSEQKRLNVLAEGALGGITILHMNGHIMLYLGNVNGDPYAIHDMQGYSEPTPEGERMIVVNRVVVTNLRLGQGTKSGPFLKRLVTVRAFDTGSS